MKPYAILTAAVLFVALFILAPATADNVDYYVSASGTMSTAEWRIGSCSGDVVADPPPEFDTNDTITICHYVTLTVDSAIDVAAILVPSYATMAITSADVETDTLTIYGVVTTGANTLTITAASGLTINNGSTGGRLEVNHGGTVDLTDGGNITIAPTAANYGVQLTGQSSTLRIRSDSAIVGNGHIRGFYNTALVTIDSGATVENEVTIRGALTVYASGATFQNDGKVWANDATSVTQDTLTFDAGTITGTGSFEVDTADAYLEFDATGVNATAIWGTLTISAGTVDCETQVVFLKAGSFEMTGGTILVDTATDPRAMFEAH